MAGLDTSIPALVLAARRGDRTAFAALVARERDGLLRTARAVLGDPHEAEDCAQDAFVAAWRHLDDLREPERFHAWVVTILVRLSRRRRRELLRRRTAGDLSALSAREGGPDPRLDALAREVDRLPDSLRLPLTLHYLAGLGYRETAGALAVPEKRVKSRLFEARKKLRGRLEHEPR